MIRKISGVCILIFLALGLTAYGQQNLVIRGGTLIDGNGGPPVANATLVIEGDRIREIRTTDGAPVPSNARVIDARGKFIIPGLHEGHAHYTDWTLPFFINHGVTTIHDIGTNETEWILAQRDMLRKEKIVGPRLYSCVLNLRGRPRGPNSTEGHSVFFETVAEARRAAQRAVALQADCLKVHNGLTGEMLLAISQVAREHGLAVIGHVPRALDAFQAVELGQNHLEHTDGVGRAIAKNLDGLNSLREEYARALEGRASFSFESSGIPFFDPDPSKQEELIKILVSKEVFVEADWVLRFRNITPRKRDWAFEDLQLLSRPELPFVPKDAYFRWNDYSAWESFSPELKAKLTHGMENLQKFVVKFAQAGGKVVVGTEAPNAIPGLSIHRNMQLLVDAGIPPMKAIQAATKNIAEMMRIKDLGTLEVNKYADLLILDGDPLQDIANTQEIAEVIKSGKIVDRRYSADWRNPIPTTVWQQTSHNSPTPVISTVDPPVAVEGDPDKTIRIHGERFMIGSEVYVNQRQVKVTFKSPKLLEATLPRGLLAQVGTYPIQVKNPEPLPPLENAGISNKFMFIVKYR